VHYGKHDVENKNKIMQHWIACPDKAGTADQLRRSSMQLIEGTHWLCVHDIAEEKPFNDYVKQETQKQCDSTKALSWSGHTLVAMARRAIPMTRLPAGYITPPNDEAASSCIPHSQGVRAKSKFLC
jgi:hypothetical protein